MKPKSSKEYKKGSWLFVDTWEREGSRYKIFPKGNIFFGGKK